MFDTDPKDDPTVAGMSRRSFLVAASTAAGAVALLAIGRYPREVKAEDEQVPASAGQPVQIALFDDSGKMLRTVTVSKIVKSQKEWKHQLSSNAYEITRKADTEMAFSGSLWNQHGKGLYRCICCDTALFSSETKFESGTGWPSFWQPVAKENVAEQNDASFGMERTAVACKLCDAHLGHVFTDGPRPTGLRYCMNSASLRFVPQKTGA